MRSAEEIVSLYRQRLKERSPFINQMEEVRRHYNGDVVVPLPELDELEKPAVANLISQGIEQFSMRVASVMPDVSFPALRPGIQASEDKAYDRRMATLGWWDMNRMPIKMRRRARYMTAYGSSPITISPVALDPNDRRAIPFWRPRNPLATFPAASYDPDNMEPENCIFVDKRTLAWLRTTYPEQARALYTAKESDDVFIDILEYVDAEETVLVAMGMDRRPDPYSSQTTQPSAMQIILERIPNRAGICPVVMPGRITLDRMSGMFDQLLGMYQRQAKLDALETIAVFRSIFQDEWIVSHPNANGKVRVVEEADGKQGRRGIIENGNMQLVGIQTNQGVPLAMDRLERAQRLTAGIPAEFGGESPSNIRTARRGEMVMGSTVDMPIQELQEIFAASMEAEIRRAIAYQKAYNGSKPSQFVMGTSGEILHKDYVPNEAFETDLCYVKYSMPGSDVNGMVIAIGQRVGTGIMSKQTAREMDPAIEDPVRERDQVELEGIRQALLTGLEQQAASGQLDPASIARIAKIKAERHVPLEIAVNEVHEEMQKQQAMAAQAQQQGTPFAPPGQEAVNPEQPNMVDQMPGMAPAAAPGAPIAPPEQGQVDLASMLRSLRQPANQSFAERALGQ